MSSKGFMSSSDSTQSSHQPVHHKDIEKMGYLKKLKTMKKKFFVLRKESSKPARLEYYDSEKKFKSGQPPKRSITLKKCFNINKRSDTRQKHCLALYTKDDCFCLVLESQEEAEEWLRCLLSLQRGGATEPGEVPKPAFEFVWQVKVQEKGLGASHNIIGSYRVCLTERSVSLVKMGCQDEAEEEKFTYEFSLMSIRRYGASQCFFYMEVGRSSVTGAGELWMVTEDQHIAQHMHSAIITAMSRAKKAVAVPSGVTPPSAVEPEPELGPKPRNRSCSANEASKPISVLQRRLTHANDSMGYLANTTAANSESTTSFLSSQAASPCTEHPGGDGSRERCDSLPCAPRTRTTSEGYCLPTSSAPHHARVLGGGHPMTAPHHIHHHHGSGHHNFLTPARPHSMYSRAVSYSPPIDCSPVSPVSGGCGSTDSAGSSLSIDETDGSSLMWCSGVTRSLTESIGGTTPPSRYSGLDNGRYGQMLSPDDSIPGSIIEETQNDYLLWGSHISEEEHQEQYMQMERPSVNLSLPLSTVVSSPQPLPTNINNNNKYTTTTKSGSPSQSFYMDMSSPVASSPLDIAGGYILMSPGTDITPQASTAPSFPRSSGLFVSGGGVGSSGGGGGSTSSANHSRASSIAEDTPLGYVPMISSQMSHSLSHHHDDGYVHMEPDQSRESPGGSSCSLTSGTPSMTNTGDHNPRFSSEYHLEKVSCYFTPSEDEEEGGSCTSGSLTRQQEGPQPRPARAYSLGSRPDSISRRHRLDLGQHDLRGLHQSQQQSRTRAFSMGAQVKPASASSATSRIPPQPHRHHSPISLSTSRIRNTSPAAAPILSSSWSGSSNNASQRSGRRFLPSSKHHPHSSLEPISVGDNLMEMDFSKNEETDYLDMDVNPPDKLLATTSPVYVDMRKNCSQPIDLPKRSPVVPLWGRSSDPDRVSPNCRGSSDYMNMRSGSKQRGSSQPINIAAGQPAVVSSCKSSTSPVLFGLSGILSRKTSTTGTPPKVPEQSGLSSPFSSLRRRSKRNSKKNKDKRNSVSSDDTSNSTTPVGVFPFSPSTPSKSFVPEEHFAKCSMDASSGSIRIDQNECVTPTTDVAESVPSGQLTSLYSSFEASNLDDSHHQQMNPPSESKRKISTALRPPIISQSGRSVENGYQDILQTPVVTRPRSSSSESEYVSMQPSARRKFSDIADYGAAFESLDKTRKCASDNLLDSGTTDYAVMTPGRGIDLRPRQSEQDYAAMRPHLPGKPSEKSGPSFSSSCGKDASIRAPSLLHQDDYAMMVLGNSLTPPRIIKADETCPAETSSSNEDYTFIKPGPAVTILTTGTPERSPNTASSDNNACMVPGDTSNSHKPAKFTAVPCRPSVLRSQKSRDDLSSLDDYALLAPNASAAIQMLPDTSQSLSREDYALMTPGTIGKPPAIKSDSVHQSPNLQSKKEDDYALMVTKDSTSPKLLEIASKNSSLSSVNYEDVVAQKNSESNSLNLPKCSDIEDCDDYAILMPGKSVEFSQTNLEVIKSKETSSSRKEDYAVMVPRKLDKSCKNHQNATQQSFESVKSAKCHENLFKTTQENAIPCTSKKSSGPPSRLPTVKETSPTLKLVDASTFQNATVDESDYVLMTPAIKPPMLPARDSPLSLHLHNPTTAHSPLVVICRGKDDQNLENSDSPSVSLVYSKPLTTVVATVPNQSITPTFVPKTMENPQVTSVASSSSSILTSSSGPMSTVPTTTTIAIIQPLCVTTSTSTKNPTSLTKTSAIPLPYKSTPPVNAPKSAPSFLARPPSKFVSTKSNEPKKATTTPTSLLKPSTPGKSIPVSMARTSPGAKTTSTTTTTSKPGSKASQLKSMNKCGGPKTTNKTLATPRRSTSRSPLPAPQELNYASLDLPQLQDTSEEGSNNPSLTRNLSSDSSGESDVTTASTMYAQIDFLRTQQNKKIAGRQERKT